MTLTVSKFGGSSMQDAKAMLRSASITLRQKSDITLVSATGGTTDCLLDLIDTAINKDWNSAEKILFILRERHFDILKNLTADDKALSQLKEQFFNLETLIKGVYLLKECSPRAHDNIVSFGEKISSLLFCEAVKIELKNEGEAILFDSTKLLKTDSYYKKAKALVDETQKACMSYFKFAPNTFYIGQGFIGSDKHGFTTTLGRGGSDYSAALFAEAVSADVLEIWTDVAGIASTDPRICSDARPIKEISYDEASEMAQYGAKILHPTTLVPAMRKGIPVFVGSSYESEEVGTWIREEVLDPPLVRAITKRSNQALLTIKTPKMLNTFGFMGRIFDTFTKHQISVDCVTTSEISVAVSTDLINLNNEELICDLALIGEVSTEQDFSLISLIGNHMLEHSGLAHRVFANLKDINIRMLCLGASAYNFNILIHQDDANTAVKNLHKEFI